MGNIKLNNQNGRSMIEMLGVLAIIGVLSVGGIAGYSKAMMKYRINKTIEQVSQISQNVRTFFAPQRSYEGLYPSTETGRAIIEKAKLMPDEMWDNGSVYQGAFGSVMTTVNNSDNKTFEIEFSSIPQEACIELATFDWNSVSSGFIGIATTTESYTDFCLRHKSYSSCPDTISHRDGKLTKDGKIVGEVDYGEVYVGGTIGIPVPIDKATMMCGTENRIIFLFK
ncbi:MAG: hypothetical protein IKO06_00265 [Alphaproteobacteria bacterium]|nr:hypothetical protein [Alphaproteobacteria bacterium]